MMSSLYYAKAEHNCLSTLNNKNNCASPNAKDTYSLLNEPDVLEAVYCLQ